MKPTRCGNQGLACTEATLLEPQQARRSSPDHEDVRPDIAQIDAMYLCFTLSPSSLRSDPYQISMRHISVHLSQSTAQATRSTEPWPWRRWTPSRPGRREGGRGTGSAAPGCGCLAKLASGNPGTPETWGSMQNGGTIVTKLCCCFTSLFQT